jgi:CRP-like cAMP-binding protein
MPHLKNRLLARLDSSTLERLRALLRTEELRQGQVLADLHQPVHLVHFPLGGILSCVVDLLEGPAIATGMIGCDGEYGAGPALDDRRAMSRVIVQVSGLASVIDAYQLGRMAMEIPPLRKALMDYEQYFLAQAQQTAACNACHDVEARMCKWLLRMHELAGDDLPLTQDFMAQMMGVRRTSVSTIAASMQRQELISYRRGRLHLLDLENLRRRCCECHAALQAHHDVIFG